MSFDWTDYLNLAISLQLDPESPDLFGLSEAAFRSAASRAYYATFHCALDLACREGFRPTSSGEDHWAVQDHFRNYVPPDTLHSEVARELNLLHIRRKDADYEDHFEGRPKNQATLAINLARSILENLDCIRSARPDVEL